MGGKKKRLRRLDRISNLPPCIIETILCLLPTKEAVKTSILSTGWKYHWTKLPKFEFKEKLQFDETPRPQAERKLFSVINQVMSMHESPIQEFSLNTYAYGGACVEVDRIIDTFSRNNNLKKLRLFMYGYWSPQSFFSLHKLTNPSLQGCSLDVPPTFGGFRSLTNLSMIGLNTTKRMLQLFLSGCPLLKTVTLIPDFGSLPDYDNSTLTQLFNCLPAEIQSLTVSYSIMKFYNQRSWVPNQLPAALVHLKHLCIIDVIHATHYKDRLHCFIYLLRSCPNMEKLTLRVYSNLQTIYIGEGDNYSDIWLGHLNEVEIHFTNEGTSFNFIGVILGKSPVLKTVKIVLCHTTSKDDKLSIQRTYSRYKRLSPMVEFIVTSGKFVNDQVICTPESPIACTPRSE